MEGVGALYVVHRTAKRLADGSGGCSTRTDDEKF